MEIVVILNKVATTFSLPVIAASKVESFLHPLQVLNVAI